MPPSLKSSKATHLPLTTHSAPPSACPAATQGAAAAAAAAACTQAEAVEVEVTAQLVGMEEAAQLKDRGTRVAEEISAAPAPQLPKTAKPASQPRQRPKPKGVAQYCEKEKVVACASGAAACERHAKSAEAYRVRAAEEEYPKQCEKYFGVDGKGFDRHGMPTVLGAFPDKKRRAKDGGDWDMARSVTVRPQCSGSIYAQFKLGVAECTKYESICNQILNSDNKPPSGWGEEDLMTCILYNLKLRHDAAPKEDLTGEHDDEQEDEQHADMHVEAVAVSGEYSSAVAGELREGALSSLESQDKEVAAGAALLQGAGADGTLLPQMAAEADVMGPSSAPAADNAPIHLTSRIPPLTINWGVGLQALITRAELDEYQKAHQPFWLTYLILARKEGCAWMLAQPAPSASTSRSVQQQESATRKNERLAEQELLPPSKKRSPEKARLKEEARVRELHDVSARVHATKQKDSSSKLMKAKSLYLLAKEAGDAEKIKTALEKYQSLLETSDDEYDDTYQELVKSGAYSASHASNADA